MQKHWNVLTYVLVLVIFHVIYFKRNRLKRNFGSLGIYTILCWSSDAPPPLVQQKFKFLASSIVQVSMSLSPRCDAVSVCLLRWTHTHFWSASWGTLNVNAVELWHARGPPGLARRWLDLCACIAGLRGTHLFSLWIALFWTTKVYVQVSRDERLSKT